MRQLPKETLFARALAWCILALLCTKADAQTIEGWGQVVDPLKDCQVAARQGVLSITVPGTQHDLFFGTDAPRVLQDVDGDFFIQVRVRKFAKPKPKSAVNPKNPYSYVSSGIVVWQDQQNYLRLQRAANGDSTSEFIHANQVSAGKMTANGNIRIADLDVYLRVERTAGKLGLSFSNDDQTWATIHHKGPLQPLPPKVKVGVFTINATNEQIVHEFTELKRAR